MTLVDLNYEVLSTAGQWAVNYAERGIPVFPVKITPAGGDKTDKVPLTTSGHLDATTDVEQVVKWWTRDPDAAIGGDLSRAGMFAVDVDVTDGAVGPDTLADLEVELGKLPDTVEVITASGGRHLWFTGDVGALNGWRDDIDVKGSGGWVVLPGSYSKPHDEYYIFEASSDLFDDVPVANIPETWFQYLPRPGGGSQVGAAQKDRAALAQLHPLDRQAVEVLERLGGHTVTVVKDRDDSYTARLTRPGKRSGTSVSIGRVGPGLARTFTPNWTCPDGTKLTDGKVYDLDELLAVAGEGDGYEDWETVDLGPALRGEVVLAEPAVLRREDGAALFYPGQVNGIHGVDGGGKSWVQQVAAAQELNNGNHVVWADFEDPNETTIVGRLRILGVPDERIEAQFHYLNPKTPATSVAVAKVCRVIEEHSATLTVVDSLGEAFGVEGVNENNDDEVGPWIRRVLRVLAETGTAVVSIDHSTKAQDNPLHPSGSKRKRAAITGASYLVTATRALSKETGGEVQLRCAKDRHGNYRRNDVAATLDFTVYPDSGMTWHVRAPSVTDQDQHGRLNALARQVLRVAQGYTDVNGTPPSKKIVQGQVKGRAVDIDAAIEHAENVGSIRVDRSGRSHTIEYLRDLPQGGQG